MRMTFGLKFLEKSYEDCLRTDVLGADSGESGEGMTVDSTTHRTRILHLSGPSCGQVKFPTPHMMQEHPCIMGGNGKGVRIMAKWKFYHKYG